MVFSPLHGGHRIPVGHRNERQQSLSFMERQAVSSSNIASVGYDENLQLLEVEFHSGLVYQYMNVPSVVFTQLMEASSVGQFFNTYVKNAYPTQRV